MASVLWFQGGACSGNTMSFLNAEEPTVVDLIVDFGLEIVWHPSLVDGDRQGRPRSSSGTARGARRQIDIFVYEGSVIEGPNGTGRFDMFAGRPMKDWVDRASRRKAGIVVAIGDCASWGGIPADAAEPVRPTGPAVRQAAASAAATSARTSSQARACR